jgi:hypothetical protein
MAFLCTTMVILISKWVWGISTSEIRQNPSLRQGDIRTLWHQFRDFASAIISEPKGGLKFIYCAIRELKTQAALAHRVPCSQLHKYIQMNWVWWLIPVILGTWRLRMGGSWFRNSPGKISQEPISINKKAGQGLGGCKHLLSQLHRKHK